MLRRLALVVLALLLCCPTFAFAGNRTLDALKSKVAQSKVSRLLIWKRASRSPACDMASCDAECEAVPVHATNHCDANCDSCDGFGLSSGGKLSGSSYFQRIRYGACGVRNKVRRAAISQGNFLYDLDAVMYQTIGRQFTPYEDKHFPGYFSTYQP